MSTESRKHPRLLEGLLILALVLVATVQVFLSNTSNLTTWRGGGFGMYTDPHPHLGRPVWLQGEHDGSARAVRLAPLDERLQAGCRRNTALRRDMHDLLRVGSRSQGFPAAADLCWARGQLLGFLKKHGTDPGITALFPTSDLRMTVLEIGITPDYQRLGSRVLSDRDLCEN
jgi:hypothetical protein